ncbi:MAG: hypothetical protein DMD73_05755 [Gemmatimonadetes bacterium]|nr:MAG: hypothetical protein DMD73_05755 [Gemmatimonadota bacterium]
MKHNSLWEGTRLGLVVATTIWVWLAGVDAIVGQPFRTFTVLGGIAQFTLLHYLLNVAYGVAIVWALHRAAREPSLVMGVAFGFFILEFGFAMLTILLSHLGLGELAWVRILGGNLVGAALAAVLLFRTHPVVRELRQAQTQDDD